MIRKKRSLFRRLFIPLAISLALGILILSTSLLYTYSKTYLQDNLQNTHQAIAVLESVFKKDFNEVSESFKFANQREFYLSERAGNIEAILDNQSMTTDTEFLLLYDCSCETCDDKQHYDNLKNNYVEVLKCDCKICKTHVADSKGNIKACMMCDFCLSHGMDIYGNIVLCGCELCSSHKADNFIKVLACGCKVCKIHGTDQNGNTTSCGCEICNDTGINSYGFICSCHEDNCKHKEENYMNFVRSNLLSFEKNSKSDEVDKEYNLDYKYNLIDIPKEIRTEDEFPLALLGVKKISVEYRDINGRIATTDLGKIVAIKSFDLFIGENDVLSSALRDTLLGGLIAMVVLFIIVFICTYNASKPITRMTEATKRYGEGDFSERIPVERDDEIGELTTSFNKMANDLSITENSRRAFVANVSHELKTPMTTIGGFIDGIVDGTIPPEKQEYYLKIVSSEVKRLSRLVNQMLNLSRIEEGKTQVNPTDFNISKQLVDTILTFEKQIEDKDIGITGLDTLDAIYLNADEDMINQVIYNLVENAIKFTPQNGRIDFRVEEINNSVSISIGNTGDGIPSEQLPRIFERFYKVDSSRSYDKKGAGLGLYLVKTLVELHGGQISVSSTEGEYTKFDFTIPKKANKSRGENNG